MLSSMSTARFACLLLILATGLAQAGGGSERPQDELRHFFLLQGLGRIASHAPAGLGEEASRAHAWMQGRAAPRLEQGNAPALVDGTDRFELSAELATALARLGDYQALSMEARRLPVSSAELRAAVLEAETVTLVRSLFDRAIDQAILLDGVPVVPELGGDALLSRGVLELREFQDPTREALRAVAERGQDPEALAALFAEPSESLSLLDETGQPEREVALYREREARGVPEERRRRPFDMAVDTVLRNGSDTFTMHPREQLACVFEHEWHEGRLVGLWHLHPPGWGPSGWEAAAPPSADDRQLARTTGQFLTLVFRPDGFDLHDLQTPLFGAPPPETEERTVRHRSEAWRAHFATRHAAWRSRLTTSP